MADEFDYSLFGDILVKPSTGESETPVNVLKNKVIMLYFGAGWWEPCKKFTPKLHLFNQLNGTGGSDKEDYEIVFCSMDRSEAEYNEYAEQMPWWCLPYAISTLPKLAAIYHAKGMPHLVIIDTDGKVITKSGVDELGNDPQGEFFPWRPIRIVDLLPEDYLVVENDEDEAMYPLSDLDDKYVMLYFSAGSDSFSREFTPWLVKAYNILKEKHPDDFELIFVSGDESEAGFYNTWSEMGFGAIPFEEQGSREGLESRLNIESYPTLVMLGPKPVDESDNFGDRPIINTEVRAVIENGDYITNFPFYPNRWGDLCNTTDDINMHKCLIVFHEGGDENEQMDVEDAVQEAAEDYYGDDYIKFYWANDPESPLAINIRQVCDLGEIREEPTMVLLDIKDDGAYYVSKETEISLETIKFFLLNYKDSEQQGQI